MSKQAWLVDLDGTLYRPRPLKLRMAWEVLCEGRKIAPALRRFREEHEQLRRELVEPVASPYLLQLERAAARCGLSAHALRAIVEEWMIARPARWIARFARRELLAEIQQAKERGLALALVSDYPAQRKLQALGASALFDTVVANGEPGGPGRLKPWPDGYALAAQRLGVAAAHCLVIGDRHDADGAAAQQAGMQFRYIK